MSTQNVVPIPLQDPIAQPARIEFVKRGQKDPKEGTVTQAWLDWFTSQSDSLSASSTRINTVPLTTQFAAIAPTDFSGANLSAGLYRISYYARITQAAGVNSSLTVTFDWTDGGVSPSFSGAAITGNTTTTFQSATFPIHIDSLSPVRYSTAYVSVGAPVMQYALYIFLETMPS